MWNTRCLPCRVKVMFPSKLDQRRSVWEKKKDLGASNELMIDGEVEVWILLLLGARLRIC